jgi:EmrB/QacA subfamily drug resistance transporter
MLLLDITVVNVALPDIQRSLHSSFSDLQWVIDAYSLTLAAFLLTAGVVGDMYGRRGVFIGGLSIFSLASLTCGVSSSSEMLNLARGAQGVGGAVMFATSLALIAQAFQGKERGTAFGIYGAVIGGAVAIGPLVGGAITSTIGWRWIFFVNLPIGALAIVTTWVRVPESRAPGGRRIDWLGFLSFSLALFLLVFALVRGNDEGWDSGVIIALLVGAASLLGVFVVNEARRQDPMLDLGLFRRPAMVGVSVATFAIAASIFASFLYMTLYLQDVLGYGPLAAGLRFLPITLLAFVVAPFAGRATVRAPSRVLLGFGMLAVAVGCLLMARTEASSGWTVLLPGFLVAGVGIGVANPVIASVSVSVVPPQRSGMASGSSNTFRQVGIATGIAGLGAVFQSQVLHHTMTALQTTVAGRQVLALGGADLGQAVTGGAVRSVARSIPSNAARRALLQAYRGGFTATFDHLMVIASVIALLGSLGAFVLIRQRDFVPSYAARGDSSTGDAEGPPDMAPAVTHQ